MALDFPWMQWYPAELLNSIDCQMMTGKEIGAYCLLMFQGWVQSPQGYLPNDDETLRKLAKMTPEEWGESRDTIMGKFEVEGDRIIHPRSRRDLEKLQADKVSAVESGKRGAAKRWGKGNRDTIATPRPPHRGAHSIPIPSKSKSKSKSKIKIDTPQTPQGGQARSVPDLFEKAREAYRKAGGRVDGAHAEYEKFFKACKKSRIDANEALDALLPAIDAETRYRQDCGRADVFCAPVANFSTWLYNRRWLQEFPDVVADGEPTAKEQAESEENRKWLDDAAAGKNDGKF